MLNTYCLLATSGGVSKRIFFSCVVGGDMRTSAVVTRLPASPLEVAPSKENVCQALDTLYSTTSREERDKAQNWLLAFTQTPEAWGLSVELLGEDNITLAHFGGHTLQEKIKYQWYGMPVPCCLVYRSELPPDKQEELFRILLVALIKYNPGPTVMLTRLSVVIAQVSNVLLLPYESGDYTGVALAVGQHHSGFCQFFCTKSR